MKKLNKELRNNLLAIYPAITDIEIQDFFNTIGDFAVTWGLLGPMVLFPATQLSILLGKYRSDYSANWVNKERAESLKGQHYRLSGDELETFRNDLNKRFKNLSIKPSTWLLDWERAYDYMNRSSKSHPLIYQSNARNYVIFRDDILYIDSRGIAEQLAISHQSLCSLLSKYEERINTFGFLKPLEETVTNEVKAVLKKKYYLLNEDQAYFIGTLCRNTEQAINFKVWLVEQFSKARKIIMMKEGHDSSEAVIHRNLAELTLYTSIKVHSEYPLPLPKHLPGGAVVESIKRIDLFLNQQVAIELKKEKISVDNITDIIGTKGYYHTLKKIKTFKYLIISSPLGITHTAEKMLEVMHPKIIFLYPHQIGDRIAQQALKEYPLNAHWWLKSMVFPKFAKVLSQEFLEFIADKSTPQLPASSK